MSNDIFADLDKVRIDQTFDDISVEEVYTTIPCRKPGKVEFFRANPDPRMREKFLLLEHQEAGKYGAEKYLVMPDIVSQIRDEPGIRPYLIVPCVGRPTDTPFLWPLKVPNNTTNAGVSWILSALEVMKQSEENWVRIESRQQMQGYTCCISKAGWPGPRFPDLTLPEMLKLAFPEDRIIASTTHPVIRSLRGEI